MSFVRVTELRYGGGVPVEVDPGSVVAHRGARVGVAGGFLHDAPRQPRVKRRGDVLVPQGVRPDRLVDGRPAGATPHDPSGGMEVKTLAVASQEDRPLHALADGEVDGPSGVGRQRNGDDLAPLRRTIRVRWLPSRPSPMSTSAALSWGLGSENGARPGNGRPKRWVSTRVRSDCRATTELHPAPTEAAPSPRLPRKVRRLNEEGQDNAHLRAW